MNARDEVSYRLALSEGFLAEAEEDRELQRWRSCVDNSQLSVENPGKAVLTLFGATPKTHDPAREVAALLRTTDVPADIRQVLTAMLADLLALGPAEHFMTDYGDESQHRLPWDLFDQQSAEEAIAAARRAAAGARRATEAMRAWQAQQAGAANGVVTAAQQGPAPSANGEADHGAPTTADRQRT